VRAPAAPTAPQGSTAAISSSRSEPAEEMLLPLDDSETRSKKERRDRAAALRAGTSIQEKQEDKIFEEAGKSSYRQVLVPRMDGFVKNKFSKECKEIARAAWRYFIYNYQPNTGMVNAVHNYPYATLWDMGSALAGFIAAEKLSIISMKDFKGRTTRFLETLLSVELYNNELPNREYNTRTGKMTDLRNRPSHRGSGWSALDIGDS
jgi:hypothetical protein